MQTEGAKAGATSWMLGDAPLGTILAVLIAIAALIGAGATYFGERGKFEVHMQDFERYTDDRIREQRDRSDKQHADIKTRLNIMEDRERNTIDTLARLETHVNGMEKQLNDMRDELREDFNTIQTLLHRALQDRDTSQTYVP